jgi:hypothetical protein
LHELTGNYLYPVIGVRTIPIGITNMVNIPHAIKAGKILPLVCDLTQKRNPVKRQNILKLLNQLLFSFSSHR